MLNNSFCLFSIACFVELNSTAYSAFVYEVRKNCKDVCRFCRVCFLDCFKSNEVSIITHCGYSSDLVIAVVVSLSCGIGVDPFFDAVIEVRVSAFLIESSNIEFDVLALSSFENYVGIPSFCASAWSMIRAAASMDTGE